MSTEQFSHALGIAASSAAGLFAFVAGGGDIKRLHAGHASREGMQAALLAEQGTEGPPNVIEGARRLHAGLRVWPHRQGAADHAAARGRVRHHRLLHQAVCMLPSHPARGRGDVPAAQRREDRVRGHPEGRRRDLQDRGRARACAVGRFRQRAIELPLSGGARGALPRHQVRALRREDQEGPGVHRVRRQAHGLGAGRDRSALSAAAAGTRHGDDGKRHVRAPGRRGLGLAAGAARRRRADREVSRAGRAGVRREAGEGPVRAAVDYRQDGRRGAAGRGATSEGERKRAAKDARPAVAFTGAAHPSRLGLRPSTSGDGEELRGNAHALARGFTSDCRDEAPRPSRT